jgi:cyclohexyl-isocyanide hydratase
MSAPLQIGLVIFPKVTQLDFTGPLQVFSSVPGANVHLIWKRMEPVPSDSVMVLTPTITFADCPQLDVICVPGGAGSDDMVNDEEMLDFLRRQAVGAKYITSVCTGSLVLGAAGLLRGYRAATHWTAMAFLEPFGATPANTRVCVDRNRITGGGVTAGIDFALTLVSIMVDRPTAEAIQLRIEYNPAPPFNAGSPDTAPPDVLALTKEKIAPSKKRRGEAMHRAAARLAQNISIGIDAKKKAAWFPRRPFLSYGGSTLTGDFRMSAPGAYLPAVILIGCRCKSGQSRTVARTDAMVSHLRRMTH